MSWSFPPRPAGICGPAPTASAASRKYLLDSLDDSLKRMGLDYVDIFYAHRPWNTAPLEETMGALGHRRPPGQSALCRHLLLRPGADAPGRANPQQMGVPLLIHQPSYSMLNRWIEKGLLDVLGELGAGCIAFSPLAQGLLTKKYLNGVPENSRATRDDSSMLREFLDEANLTRVRALNAIAEGRGQTLAQMAIAWVLRDQRITSALIGARNVAQLDDSLDAVKKLEFTDAELKEIDGYAQEEAWTCGRARASG